MIELFQILSEIWGKCPWNWPVIQHDWNCNGKSKWNQRCKGTYFVYRTWMFSLRWKTRVTNWNFMHVPLGPVWGCRCNQKGFPGGNFWCGVQQRHHFAHQRQTCFVLIIPGEVIFVSLNRTILPMWQIVSTDWNEMRLKSRLWHEDGKSVSEMAQTRWQAADIGLLLQWRPSITWIQRLCGTEMLHPLVTKAVWPGKLHIRESTSHWMQNTIGKLGSPIIYNDRFWRKWVSQQWGQKIVRINLLMCSRKNLQNLNQWRMTSSRYLFVN